MPTENVLAGIRCPACNQEAEFRIHATAVFNVTDEGTGDYHSVEWTDNSRIGCLSCNHTGLVKDFAIQNNG